MSTYLEAYKVLIDDDKITFATSLLRGNASTWWRNVLQEVKVGIRANGTWEDFKRAIEMQFGVVNKERVARD